MSDPARVSADRSGTSLENCRRLVAAGLRRWLAIIDDHDVGNYL